MNTVKILKRCKSFCNLKNFYRTSFYPVQCGGFLVDFERINKAINNVSMTTVSRRFYSVDDEKLIDGATYERVCDETLESLSDYLEELVENTPHLKNTDVTYGSGILTINFGEPYGTYVINRQIPNRQIWLSSPTSGPKRYDFVVDKGYWIYKHDKKSLHQLLQEEIKSIVKKDVNFSKCSYSLVHS